MATLSPSVLVTDGEVAIVDLLAALLEDKGFHVLRAYDGEQPRDLALRDMPDLVISDIAMPRLDGLDLRRRMRTSTPLRETPVISMSAAVRRLDNDRATFIAKPFNLDLLLPLVEVELPFTGGSAPSPCS